jgi:hypothetical protein
VNSKGVFDDNLRRYAMQQVAAVRSVKQAVRVIKQIKHHSPRSIVAGQMRDPRHAGTIAQRRPTCAPKFRFSSSEAINR